MILNLPIKTELCYYLEGIPDDFNVFLVGLSIKEIKFNQSSIKFLSGLGYAMYIAAFEQEEQLINNNVKDKDKIDENSDNKELDNKIFDPISIISPRPSCLNLSDLIIIYLCMISKKTLQNTLSKKTFF
jgi:hypothetical protein